MSAIVFIDGIDQPIVLSDGTTLEMVNGPGVREFYLISETRRLVSRTIIPPGTFLVAPVIRSVTVRTDK